MIVENKPKYVRIEREPGLILGVIFVVVLLLAICALGVMVLNELVKPRLTTQQNIPVLIAPAAKPDAMQANQFSTLLPVILSGSVSASGQIWKVTKIKSLGYELEGQHYDLATFSRIDGQDTVKGYCINRGWDIPDIGTEYLLNADGIFVPLYEPDTQPFQRL